MQHPRRPAAVCTHDHSIREYRVTIDTLRRMAERGKNRLPADVHGHGRTETCRPPLMYISLGMLCANESYTIFSFVAFYGTSHRYVPV